MLSIDFGNTYTKVGLRLDSDAPGELLKDASLKWDDMNACVPTVAACFEPDGKTAWHYGTDVLKFRENTPGLAVYRNWKPRFFEGPGTRRAAAPAGRSVAVPVGGPALSAPPGVTADAWEKLKGTLSPEELVKVWVNLGGGSAPVAVPAPPAVEETEPIYKHIGLGFFRWLREFFDPVCHRRLGRPASEVPARVSLPSFGSVAKAEMLLTHILTDAGWRLDDRAPVLPEPLSNAIGTFTEGVNATHLNRTQPHYGRMFQHTGLLARMREALLNGGPKSAWVLIADLGGYTADFAMVGFDLTDIDARFDGEINGKPRLAHKSRPIGVTDLDSRVRELLPEPKRKALDQAIADPDQQRLESFHKNCFGHLGRHTLKKVTIGDSAKEKGLIREVIAQFAEEVADDAEGFLDTYQYDQIDDLILTGGGTMIPAVREALCKRLSHYGVRKVHLYMADGENPVSSIPPHPLKSVLVRGATAIGGASLYFDYAEE
jgi:hypothetical protein